MVKVNGEGSQDKKQIKKCKSQIDLINGFRS